MCKPELSSFLKRRDMSSNQRGKNFPSTVTYNEINKKIKKKFNCETLDQEFFIKTYNKLKKQDYLEGDKVISLLDSQSIPNIWLKTGVLKDNDDIVAIALLIDYGRPVSLFNIAGMRSNLSYGLILCAEIIDYCGRNLYFSFDCGVSGLYGNYKHKLFLDSYNVCQNEKIIEKKKSIWNTIKRTI